MARAAQSRHGPLPVIEPPCEVFLHLRGSAAGTTPTDNVIGIRNHEPGTLGIASSTEEAAFRQSSTGQFRPNRPDDENVSEPGGVDMTHVTSLASVWPV